MMTFLKVALVAILAAALTAAIVIYAGIYNVAADEPHWPPTRWILDFAMARSIAVRESGIAVPDDLGTVDQISRGAVRYQNVCAGCHLGPGVEPTPLSSGMKPMPPNLVQHVTRQSSANLFWVIKHGIKMSGMPALGASFTDDELWDVVAFVNTLPDLGPADYQRSTNTITDKQL